MGNAVFPTLAGLAWGQMKTPMWKTDVKEAISGREFRWTLMTYPRYRVTMSYEVLRADSVNAELQTLIGFFNLRRGSFDSFLWTDPDDNQVANAVFGTGDGATKTFSLSRLYGGFAEPVVDLNGTPVIKVNGVAQLVPSQCSVAGGKVTFVTAPPNGAALTWSGSFYRRVRFLRDEADFEKFLQDLWTAKKVELITVKE